MKTLKCFYIVLTTVALLTVQSCSLDEHIKDQPTPATITTQNDVTAIINGTYARLNDSNMFKYLGHLMLVLCADDFYSEAGYDFGPYGQRTFTNQHTAPMWDNLYASIANANNLINVLDNMQLNADFKKRAYGDAYFIRAFCYYYLVRLYGGVPLRLEPTSINSNFYLPRASVDETYAQIFKDFKAASERLPLQSSITISELGRASKGAAQALLAQAYLTYGDQLTLHGQDGTAQFQSSVTYADSVLTSGQYSLINDYADLFEVAKELQAYKEVIFGIRFQTDGTTRGMSAAGSEYALRFNGVDTYFVSANGDEQNGDATYRVMPWFADYYRTGDYASSAGDVLDYRNEAAFWQSATGRQNRTYYIYPTPVPSGASNYTIPYPLCRKYIDPTGKDSRNHGNDFFIIRLAELYLIKAEALNELYGPNADALAAFNKVRERARNANGVARAIPANLTTVTAGDKDKFRMKIFDERGLELVGEGQRWFDLVRMRSPRSYDETMYAYQFLYRFQNKITGAGYPTYTAMDPLTLTFNNTTKLYSAYNTVYKPTLNVTVPRFLLFPVPATERLQNKNFGPQNPGWGN
ncbi:RagB/SusD family nutrient uptake outer membrane protein [Pedobacter sp. BS3]|uniref:RagB/SusD family nutrient uptake outer membrane protein n=1 Tax=Pedobacter sp. BS3 TaxID=2567937 RepID=UPI00165A0A40|nr:RagB/SusD family nutrient uptake outer membrane protein [Pedobacter sp. BS3]